MRLLLVVSKPRSPYYQKNKNNLSAKKILDHDIISCFIIMYQLYISQIIIRIMTLLTVSSYMVLVIYITNNQCYHREEVMCYVFHRKSIASTNQWLRLDDLKVPPIWRATCGYIFLDLISFLDSSISWSSILFLYYLIYLFYSTIFTHNLIFYFHVCSPLGMTRFLHLYHDYCIPYYFYFIHGHILELLLFIIFPLAVTFVTFICILSFLVWYILFLVLLLLWVILN